MNERITLLPYQKFYLTVDSKLIEESYVNNNYKISIIKKIKNKLG